MIIICLLSIYIKWSFLSPSTATSSLCIGHFVPPVHFLKKNYRQVYVFTVFCVLGQVHWIMFLDASGSGYRLYSSDVLDQPFTFQWALNTYAIKQKISIDEFKKQACNQTVVTCLLCFLRRLMWKEGELMVADMMLLDEKVCIYVISFYSR